MTDEGRAKKILLTNLSKLYARAEATEEQRRICVTMLAERVVGSSEQIDRLYSSLTSSVKGLSAEHKARLCACLWGESGMTDELMRFFDKRFSIISEKISESAAGRIAYVRNKRSDDIFLSLSKNTRGARAHYCVTFQECCEAVLDGRCEYCLLPIENSSDGRLYSFYSLLDRYELKINRTVSVGNEDDSQTVVFALAGKSVRLTGEHGQRLEFSVISENAGFVSDIIRAAQELGGVVSSMGTQPLEYDEVRKRFYIAVDMCENASPIPMALYVALEFPRATPLGIYTVK